MPEEKNPIQKKNSIDWLMRGVLTKIGDTFDRLTGRRWMPSSSLSTSELIEKLKKLLDAEVKDFSAKGKYVPHNIKLKMQWDKFSTDSNEAITRLENELKIAAIDHINDNRYHTYAPIHLEVTPDYFTEGVKLLASFDKFDEEKREVSVNVTVPQIKVGDYLPELPPPEIKVETAAETFIAKFNLSGNPKQKELSFKEKQRKSVGRSKENDLNIEDASVSKIHAALVLNSEKQLMVADTGSTNGTFINGERIAYGRAFPIAAADKVKFGNIEVAFEHVSRQTENAEGQEVMMSQNTSENNFTSQQNVPTVAFNSNEDVKIDSKIQTSQIVAESPAPDNSLAETQFVQVKPEAERKNAAETNDRINYEFTNED